MSDLYENFAPAEESLESRIDNMFNQCGFLRSRVFTFGPYCIFVGQRPLDKRFNYKTPGLFCRYCRDLSNDPLLMTHFHLKLVFKWLSKQNSLPQVVRHSEKETALLVVHPEAETMLQINYHKTDCVLLVVEVTKDESKVHPDDKKLLVINPSVQLLIPGSF